MILAKPSGQLINKLKVMLRHIGNQKIACPVEIQLPGNLTNCSFTKRLFLKSFPDHEL